MRHFRKSHPSTNERYQGKHRFEHWYRDNSVYFITARCRDKYHAFASEEAKQIFWDRFDHYAQMHRFDPWVVSLMSNHYHVLGYYRHADQLGEMMRKLHGSVAKLVNDLLPERRVPFWGVHDNRDYFDGCLRVGQLEPTYRYVHSQCRRHGICRDPSEYVHTRVFVTKPNAIQLAGEYGALLKLPYPRYRRDKPQRH